MSNVDQKFPAKKKVKRVIVSKEQYQRNRKAKGQLWQDKE